MRFKIYNKRGKKYVTSDMNYFYNQINQFMILYFSEKLYAVDVLAQKKF